jgi:hypothetical protein
MAGIPPKGHSRIVYPFAWWPKKIMFNERRYVVWLRNYGIEEWLYKHEGKDIWYEAFIFPLEESMEFFRERLKFDY